MPRPIKHGRGFLVAVFRGNDAMLRGDALASGGIVAFAGLLALFRQKVDWNRCSGIICFRE